MQSDVNLKFSADFHLNKKEEHGYEHDFGCETTTSKSVERGITHRASRGSSLGFIVAGSRASSMNSSQQLRTRPRLIIVCGSSLSFSYITELVLVNSPAATFFTCWKWSPLLRLLFASRRMKSLAFRGTTWDDRAAFAYRAIEMFKR